MNEVLINGTVVHGYNINRVICTWGQVSNREEWRSGENGKVREKQTKGKNDIVAWKREGKQIDRVCAYEKTIEDGVV